MKRVIYLYLLWVLCLTIPPLGRAMDPWGVTQASLDANIFGIDKLLSHETIYYAIADDITPQEEKVFVNALKKWPANTLAAIKRVGRTDEFKDITGLLERGVSLQKTTMNRAEVSLEIDPTGDICGQDAAGCHFTTSHRIVVRADYRHLLNEVLTHEIGHFYGLGDQYDKCRYDSSPVYSSPVNLTEGSVMRNNYETHGNLTCDDHDGFINLIDLRLRQTKGRFPQHSQNGWWSLCKKTKNFYKEAKTTNREYGFDSVDLEDPRISQSHHYDKKGNLIHTDHSVLLDENLLPLFTVSKEDQLIRDDSGRIIKIVSNKRSPLCPVSAKGSVRTFEYIQTSSISYDIRIKCAGQQETYSLPIVKSADFSLSLPAKISGKARNFRREFPSDLDQYSVAVRFKNYRVAEILAGMSGFVSGSTSIHAARLWRDPSEANYYAEVEGWQQLGYMLSENDFRNQLQSQRIIPSHRAILLEAKDAYDQIATYVPSFYNYFYKPVLGLSASTQVQQQIKKSLHKRR